MPIGGDNALAGNWLCCCCSPLLHFVHVLAAYCCSALMRSHKKMPQEKKKKKDSHQETCLGLSFEVEETHSYIHTCTFIHITSDCCVKFVDKTGTIRVFGPVSNMFFFGVGDRLTGALLPDGKRGGNNKKSDHAITN